MVIGFDGSRAFSNNKTGTENYSFQLLKALAQIDNKNQYIIYLRPSVIPNPKGEGSSQIMEDPSQSLRNDNGNWPKNFQFKVINWPRLWTQSGLALQTFKDPLEILFVPAHTLPLVRKPGLKTVVTVHDLGSEYLPSTHQLKQRLYLGLMQKYQLKTATHLISVSNATKQDLVKRLGIEEKKVSVVYEGYDKKNFQFSILNFQKEQTIKKYNLKYQNYFLFVGTVQPRKNLERLIKAFSVVANPKGVKQSSKVGQSIEVEDSSLVARNDKEKTIPLELVIAGSKGWLSDEIYRLPKKLGIEDKVKFLGYVSDKDLPVLYSAASAFTFPSLFEGFGLPILEAQACGCPVLASNLSSMPEIAGKGAVYVNPYDIGDIVKGMDRVKNQESRVKLIKAGLENVKRFGWEKCAKETLNILESI